MLWPGRPHAVQFFSLISFLVTYTLPSIRCLIAKIILPCNSMARSQDINPIKYSHHLVVLPAKEKIQKEIRNCNRCTSTNQMDTSRLQSSTTYSRGIVMRGFLFLLVPPVHQVSPYLQIKKYGMLLLA
jgi:hypothetical protein